MKRLNRLLVVSAVAVSFGAALPAFAQELVTNGGFESGTLSGFTLNGNSDFTGVTNNSAPGGGAFIAFFGSIGALGGITQTLNTTPGQLYSIKFKLQQLGGDSTVGYRVDFGTVNLVNQQPSLTPFGLTQFSYSAVATAATTALSFQFRNDPAFFLLDNISVQAISSAPEPATWAMMLLGFGVVGSAFRRRRRMSAPGLQSA